MLYLYFFTSAIYINLSVNASLFHVKTPLNRYMIKSHFNSVIWEYLDQNLDYCHVSLHWGIVKILSVSHKMHLCEKKNRQK